MFTPTDLRYDKQSKAMCQVTDGPIDISIIFLIDTRIKLWYNAVWGNTQQTFEEKDIIRLS